MPQTFFTTSGARGSKRLKIESTVPEIDVIDETVIRWRQSGFEQPQAGEKVRVAAFDLDETLTSTKSGSVFARHGHDWRLLEHMTTHLEALTRDETCRTVVVVFTNQGGVIPYPQAKSYVNLLTKIGGILKALPVISLVYAAAKAATPGKRARYRKPGRGMFELLKEQLAPGEVDMARSFYVGDAAGRPNDHSADDRNFAKALGLRFFTPEAWLEWHESQVAVANCLARDASKGDDESAISKNAEPKADQPAPAEEGNHGSESKSRTAS